MANIAIFRINYKSDFILTLNSDAGWMTPFCIKFWTGAPSQAYFAGYDGTTYTHCAPVDGEPTKLRVQFDDHHLPIGDLKFQIGYHFTVADFPTSVEDEVINQASVIIEKDGEPAQVMLDLNGETAPEIEFSLPAYANEAQRIANEEQRIAHEAIRIVNEESRIAAETIRQQNEAQRIAQETARVNEFATLKSQSQAATSAANTAAALANEKAQLAADKAALAASAAQLANDKAALAQAAAQLANDKAQLAADKAALAQAASQLCDEKAALAQQKATYAQQQGDYSKAQGDYAKEQGDYSKAQGDYSKEHGDYSKEQGDYAKDKGDICAADHQTAVADHQTATADHQTAAADHQTATTDHNQAGNDHTRAESDHTRAESDHAAVELYVDSLGVFDLSKHNAVGGVLATYADLSAALTALNALDSKYKYGGMSFKFVQTSDDKYVQYRLTADDWSTNVYDWQESFGQEYKSYNYTKDDYTNSLIKEIHIEGTKDPNLRYFIRGCRRYRNAGSTNPDAFYFAIQSYDPATSERVGIIEFAGNDNITQSGLYSKTKDGYTVTILLTLENRSDNIGAPYAAAYSGNLELCDNCWGGIDNAPLIKALTNAVSVIEDGNNHPVTSDAIYDNLVKPSILNQIVFYNTKNYGAENSESFMTAVARIPLASRMSPCTVFHRINNVWSAYVFRSNSANYEIADTYWLNSNYWYQIPSMPVIQELIAPYKSCKYTKNDYVNSIIKEIHIEGTKDLNLKYYVRSCLRNGRDSVGLNCLYFAIQSYDPSTGTRGAICEFPERIFKINKSGVYTRSQNGYITTIYVTFDNTNTNEGGFNGVGYAEEYEINDNCWGDYENAPLIANYVKQYGTSSKAVDLIMFMGQSNMAGRGVTNSSHPEPAPSVIPGAGFEFRAISDPTKLYPIAEPFGVAENNPNGIDDGNKKTGSMVAAFVNAYFRTTGKVIVGVSASEGGTNSGNWLPTSTRGLLPDALQRMEDAVTFLTNNGYTIEHKYMVWCQGEQDAMIHNTAAEYKTNTRTIIDAMKNAGIEICFLIRAGHYNGDDETIDFSYIINAQTELCRDNADIVMASTAYASFKDKGLMKDFGHYYQDAYNMIGTYSGRNVGLYRLYGIGKPQYDVMTNSLFFTDKDY